MDFKMPVSPSFSNDWDYYDKPKHGILLYDLDDLNELLKKYPNLRNKNNKYAIEYLSSELSLEIPMVATFEDEDLNYFSMQLIHSSDVVELFVIRNHKEESSLPPNGTEVKLDIGLMETYTIHALDDTSTGMLFTTEKELRLLGTRLIEWGHDEKDINKDTEEVVHSFLTENRTMVMMKVDNVKQLLDIKDPRVKSLSKLYVANNYL